MCVRERERMCGMRVQCWSLSLEKDWACGVRFLKMSCWTCGGIVTMETEMKTLLEVELTQDLSASQDRRK